jgi:hypothetical protein
VKKLATTHCNEVCSVDCDVSSSIRMDLTCLIAPLTESYETRIARHDLESGHLRQARTLKRGYQTDDLDLVQRRMAGYSRRG